MFPDKRATKLHPNNQTVHTTYTNARNVEVQRAGFEPANPYGKGCLIRGPPTAKA